jgi:lipopolysaccharide transport system permease protein
MDQPLTLFEKADSSESKPVMVYTPESQIRKPRQLIRSMWLDLKASKELAWRLFVRDISSQYRQSLFGILWAFIPPLITSAVFIFLQMRNIVNFGETDIPYPVYVIISTILWQLFTESLNAPLKSVIASKPLLVKIRFPREALIVSAFYSTLFNLAIKLILLGIIFIIFQVQPNWGWLFAFIPIFMLILLGICLGLLLTPLGMLYSDIGTSLPIVTQLFFFLTPVVYPPPESFPFSLIAYINPVSPFLIAARDLLTKGMLFNLVPLVVVSLLTILVLIIAWVVYRLAIPIIIERLSA